MTASSGSSQAEGALISPAAAELLAKVIVLVAALLPVAGVAIRTIAFLLDPDLRNITQLAVALPLAELTALGAWQLLAPITAIFFTTFLIRLSVRVESRREHTANEAADLLSGYQGLKADLESLQSQLEKLEEAGAPNAATQENLAGQRAALREQQRELDQRFERWRAESDRVEPGWVHRVGPLLSPLGRVLDRLPVRVVIGASVVFVTALAVVLPYFPLAFILWPTTSVGQILISRSVRAAGDFRLRHAWPGVAVFMIGYVVASGFVYSGPLPAAYHFVATAGIVEGSYAELGRTDDLVYLRVCDDPTKGSVAVPVSAIQLVELRPPPHRSLKPSLLDLIAGNGTLKLGATGQCDGA